MPQKRKDNSSPSTRRRPVKHAVSSPHLADIPLAELRAYRQRLVMEDEKVAYWTRLIRMRTEVLESESSLEDTPSTEKVLRVLGDTVTGRVRKALLAIRSGGDLPELPVADEIWNAEIDLHDPAEVAAAVARLRQAEARLMEYRNALRNWLDEATGELIVRYGADPARALGLLPEA